MHENFLLSTPVAKKLYHDIAKHLPVIDYHNHLSVPDILEDKLFSDLASLWLLGDPYKHRAMRMCGVPEDYITGSATNFEKFLAWSRVLPKLIGNPLYHWSQMELFDVLGIHKLLNETTAKEIWDEAGEKLKKPEFSVRGLLQHFRVEYCAPFCSLIEDISPLRMLETIAPSLRGDDLAAPTSALLKKLEEKTHIKILSLSDYKKAVRIRLSAFREAGCRFSDHAMDEGFRYHEDDGQNEKRFQALLQNEKVSEADNQKLSSEILRMLGKSYAEHRFVLQLHIGALRVTSSRLRRLAGTAGGYAGIGSSCNISEITRFLDDLEKTAEGLPKTVLYTLNPADNAVMSILSGSYSMDGVPALVQQGPAWWWCDHLTGIREVLESISAYSVLSNFIGMTTDSRSILSFVRHEYFRRALCGWVGDKAEKGEFPNSYDELEPIIKQVCYENVKQILSEGD